MPNRSFIYTTHGDQQDRLDACVFSELTKQNFETRLCAVTFGSDAYLLNTNLILKLRYDER